ncbi:MAG: cytochrome c, partial [Melioribacteraceae bacterium]|nr:cytochrome c [Melioribacteraceae bacterium]
MLRLSLILIFLLAQTANAQDTGDPVNGKALFNTNCAACHNLDRKMVGPALRNVEARLYEDEGLDREWLYSWIRNSAAMIKAGDPYAVKIYEEYNQAAMTAFPQLSDEDLNNILAYTAQEKPAPAAAVVAQTEA